ncbi:Outer membrane protein TolC [Salegentibacter echinorum]|uniref:Outer membrane protein TolC n=2 Tax=Flavobacteriales TaxID=200644 RepID=A0A1M5IBD6_SALEC|nr:Outer membrane protein TolC [Salegentibacter echinorum]
MQTPRNSMKKMLIKNSTPLVIWCMLSFLSCGSLLAQEKLNLEEVKEAALSYSNDIKNGKIRIEQAEAAKQEAIANYFPQVSATGIGLYGFKDFVPPIPEILPDGIDNFYQAGATATEVVYAGGKIRSASALASLQAETRTIQAEQATDSVILNTEQKYWQLVQVQEQLKAIRASKMYLDELLKQQQDLLSAGLIAKNQLLRVRTNRSRVLLQQSKLGNQRKLALLDLGLYVGKIYDTTTVVADTLKQVTPPRLKYPNPDLDFQNNNNYKLLEKSISASQLQTKITKADLLPQVSVGVNAGYFGTFNDAIDSQFMPVAFGMVSIPISDWWGAGRHKVKQKALQEKIVQNNFDDRKDELKIGIMKSWYDLMDAYKQINYAKDNLEYANENLKVQRDNYNSGLNNLTDLLDAQQQEESAETEYANAYANYKIAESKYLFVTNNL